MTPKQEKLISELLTTPEGRSKLAQAVNTAAQTLLDAWETYIAREGTPYGPKSIMPVIDRLLDAAQRGDAVDRVRLLSLRSDLLSLELSR